MFRTSVDTGYTQQHRYNTTSARNVLVWLTGIDWDRSRKHCCARRLATLYHSGCKITMDSCCVLTTIALKRTQPRRRTGFRCHWPYSSIPRSMTKTGFTECTISGKEHNGSFHTPCTPLQFSIGQIISKHHNRHVDRLKTGKSPTLRKLVDVSNGAQYGGQDNQTFSASQSVST